MSLNCKICGNPRSSFVMNNKTVCMKCDELLFDLEIECDEEMEAAAADPKATQPAQPNKRILTVVKK